MERPYRYRPVLFFVVTTIATWTPWFFGIYAGRTGQAQFGSLSNLIGLLAPTVVGLVMILGSHSRALKRDLADRLLNVRRIRPRFLIPALIMPPVVMALSLWISLGLGQSRDQLRLASGGNIGTMIVIALVLAPIIEETGWRGYGVDSIRSRLNVLRTTLLFGVLWSVWHAPLALIPGSYQYELAQMDNPIFLANFFVSVIPAAIIANWVYYRNDRSILAGVLLHSVLNASAVLPNAGQVAKLVVSGFYALIAVALLVFDRETFQGGPRNFVADAGPAPGAAPRLDAAAASGGLR